jgi:L-ascorbate metabolism protein UlaG (beta-lactamase superfamily)
MTMLEIRDIKISWLGVSTIKIRTPKLVIYIDPYAVYNDELADLILITHEHARHCSIEDIKRLAKEETVIIAPEYAASMIAHPFLTIIKAGEELKSSEVIVKAIPAYELIRSYLHPRNRGIGYLLNFHDTILYHAGDTDFVPEVASLRNIDVACFPIAGFENSLDQALDFTNGVKPRFIIPIHYNPATDKKILNTFESKVINSRVVLG